MTHRTRGRRAATAGAVLMLAGAIGAPPARGAASADCRWLLERFEAVVEPEIKAAVARPGTNDQGGIAWGQAYHLQGLVEVFEATREPRYADLFVKLADWVVAARDDRHGRRDEYRGRVVPAWSSTKYTDGKRYAWAVHTGMIVAPMARFAAVVRGDAKLAARYREAADRFLRVAEEAVAVHDDQYREGPGADEGYLWGLATQRNLPLNMQNALARAWIAIDDATGGRRYRERTVRLARFMKNRLRAADDGTYVWDYRPPLDGPGKGLEDTSHAAINADFLVLCFEHGIVFTREDVARVEKTLLTKVIRPDGSIANNVGGSGGTGTYRRAVFSWGRLAMHSDAVRERLTKLCRSTEGGDGAGPLGLGLLFRACAESGAPAPPSRPASREAPR